MIVRLTRSLQPFSKFKNQNKFILQLEKEKITSVLRIEKLLPVPHTQISKVAKKLQK